MNLVEVYTVRDGLIVDLDVYYRDHRSYGVRTAAVTMAPYDVITAAASVAHDAAEGRLSPAALQEQAAAECRELFGTIDGPGDALWELQVEVARDMLVQRGIPADELTEWLAVARQQQG